MALSFTPLGAARTVTGSRHLIDCDGVRVLVDCGLHQERDLLARNWEPLPVPAADIAAVLMTHAHVDHCGWLPRLVASGFRGPIHATSATCAMLPIMLEDTARLQEEDAETKRRRHAAEGRTPGRPVAPLYGLDAVPPVLERLAPVPFGERRVVAPGLTATWLPAGHILGAAMVRLEGGGSSMLLSGDLGRWDRPIVPDPSDPPGADLVVVESTYGDRLHAHDRDVEQDLERQLAPVLNAGGTVIMPTFAVERAQELLWHLRRLAGRGAVPACPVFLDSPMAVKLLRVFADHPEATDTAFHTLMERGADPFSFRGLELTPSREDSKAINRVAGAKIVIAGSGMLNGGRIKHHLDQIVHREDSLVLFTGYQATGTLGRQLVDGATRIRLFNREREVRCGVAQVQGFSGHADRDEILAWLGRLPRPPRRVAVIHGGASVAAGFADLVAARLGVPAHAPAYGERVEA